MSNQQITYAQLLEALQALPPERLQDTATVYAGGIDEFYPVQRLDISYGSDVVDDGHALMVVDDNT